MLVSRIRWTMAGGYILIFSDILVDLDVAPYFTANVDGREVKLGGLYRAKVKMAKDAGRLADEVPEVAVGGAES